jgi:hypothetical protein
VTAAGLFFDWCLFVGSGSAILGVLAWATDKEWF